MFDVNKSFSTGSTHAHKVVFNKELLQTPVKLNQYNSVAVLLYHSIIVELCMCIYIAGHRDVNKSIRAEKK